MILMLSRSLNLDKWDGYIRGKLVTAPKSAVPWMDAAYRKGVADARAEIRAVLGIKEPRS